jgi:hypothetical protein
MAAIRLIVESVVYSKDLGTAEYVQRTEATCLLFLSLTTWSLKERMQDSVLSKKATPLLQPGKHRNL